MRKRVATGALLLAVVVAGVAGAQESAPRFALATGETVAQGADMAYGQFGWPGVFFGYTHGLNDKTDVTMRFGLLYSIEGTSDTSFGVQLDIPLRLTVLRRGKTSIQVGLQPGFTIYTREQANLLLGFPITAALGVQVTPELRIAAATDQVMRVRLTNGAAFIYEPIFGPSVEYYADRQLAISLDTRFGAVVDSEPNVPARFGFRVALGVAYRL